MPKIFIRELGNIKKMILSLGAMVEERVRLAVAAVENKDAEAAQRVIKTDYEIDEMEVEVEETCLKVLALHQPVAVDLRFLIAVIKINNDLERIGDQAVNIAQRVAVLAKRRDVNFDFDYTHMAEKAQNMLRMSLDALVNLDEDLALKVVTLDDEVDTDTERRLRPHQERHEREYRQNRLHDQPAADLPPPGAPRRPCHQYRRRGYLHDRGRDHPTWQLLKADFIPAHTHGHHYGCQPFVLNIVHSCHRQADSRASGWMSKRDATAKQNTNRALTGS